jgi:hypothetical protein
VSLGLARAHLESESDEAEAAVLPKGIDGVDGRVGAHREGEGLGNVERRDAEPPHLVCARVLHARDERRQVAGEVVGAASQPLGNHVLVRLALEVQDARPAHADGGALGGRLRAAAARCELVVHRPPPLQMGCAERAAAVRAVVAVASQAEGCVRLARALRDARGAHGGTRGGGQRGTQRAAARLELLEQQLAPPALAGGRAEGESGVEGTRGSGARQLRDGSAD